MRGSEVGIEEGGAAAALSQATALVVSRAACLCLSGWRTNDRAPATVHKKFTY
jgi:hypothetical protein